VRSSPTVNGVSIPDRIPPFHRLDLRSQFCMTYEAHPPSSSTTEILRPFLMRDSLRAPSLVLRTKYSVLHTIQCTRVSARQKVHPLSNRRPAFQPPRTPPRAKSKSGSKSGWLLPPSSARSALRYMKCSALNKRCRGRLPNLATEADLAKAS
jgi:hypothetical protein